MRRNFSRSVAFGGVTGALALVIMGLGGLIPVATYICPMLCCLLLQIVFQKFGARIAWAWYGAVMILSLVMAPDRESAVVFAVLGYYPILKPAFEKLHLRWLLKFLFFNITILVAYGAMLALMGAEALGLEGTGAVLLVILIVMGNVTFYLLDRLLTILSWKIFKKGGGFHGG